MIRSLTRSRRLMAILGTGVLTLALVPGITSAANTRFLWVGAPDLKIDTVDDGIFTPDNNGVLTPTKVSVPGPDLGPNATRVDVEIYNSGGQNLANTVLTITVNPAGLPGLSLIGDATYDPTGHGDASFCTPSGNVVTCDFGSLPSLDTRTIAVVASVSTDFTTLSAHDLIKANVVTNNENGSNFQSFNASSGDFEVTEFGDDSLYTFELQGNDKHLFTSGVNNGGGDLSTDVKFNAANKELVAINEATSGDGTTGFYKCPTGLSCQSLYSEVSTTSGSFSSAPFFVWTLTAIVPKTYSLSQGFVAHYPTGALTYDFSDTTNAFWILPFKSKSSLCPSTATALATKIASAHQCLYTPTLTKFDKTHNQLMVTVVMDHQGGLKY